MARYNTTTEERPGSPLVYLVICFSNGGEEKIIKTSQRSAKNLAVWDETLEFDGDRLSFQLFDASSDSVIASATWTKIGAELGDLANDGIVPISL